MKTCKEHGYGELNRLCSIDNDFHEVITSSGLPPMLTAQFSQVQSEELFANLARKVIHQQLSTRVASVIEARLIEVCDGTLEAIKVLELSAEDLSKVGLSKSKQRAISELATVFTTDPEFITSVLSADDEGVVKIITSLFGFGQWSAQMFLLFDLGRHDVWAPLDLGVRKGYQKLTGLAGTPTYGDLKELADEFTPVGSMATWYLWRVLETP